MSGTTGEPPRAAVFGAPCAHFVSLGAVCEVFSRVSKNGDRASGWSEPSAAAGLQNWPGPCIERLLGGRQRLGFVGFLEDL